ncbi:hypothetical protein GKQ38_02005 [Candidatus Nanohaloarchaea archaeon]|nr:hypothetical protein GKQ38_02005 [Candidatus Nanohaloarchaea archaeon]
MLTEAERAKYEELEEGKWTMSGYGPGSDQVERLTDLRTKMWKDLSMEELFQEGDVEVGKFNRKDTYADAGYQGHFNVEINQNNWEQSMTYRPSFNLDYEEQVLELEARTDEPEVVDEGETVKDIRTADSLKDTVFNYLGIQK